MERYYSVGEMAEVHFVYDCANENSREARRVYAEYYP
jgi:hypothetical protein